MLSELGMYERRLDRLDAGLPPFSFSLIGEGTVPSMVDASTGDECLELLDRVLSRLEVDETIIVEDLVSGRLYRGPVGRVRGLVRSRTLFDAMI